MAKLSGRGLSHRRPFPASRPSWGVSGATRPPLALVSRQTGAAARPAFAEAATGAVLSAEDVGLTEEPGAGDLVRWRLSHAERAQESSLAAVSEPAPAAKREA